MNNREKVLTKIEQNQVDRQKLIDEAGLLNKELAELDKPKLRHGDYGYDASDYSCMAIKLATDGLKDVSSACMHDNCRGANDPESDSMDKVKTKLGNIFDDLKRNSEDLEEFAKKCRGSGVLSVKRSDFADQIGIQFRIDYSVATATIDEATEIHQKLGQIIAAAKRGKK